MTTPVPPPVTTLDPRDDDPAMHALKRLALMIDSVSDAIVTIDARGIIEYANRGAQELFGYRQDELLGRNVAMLMPPPDSGRHDAYIAAYLQTGQSGAMDHRRSVGGLRKDGSAVPLDLTLGQMMERGERKFTAVMRDITEQRRLQQVAAEAERRLQEAKDRADEANRAKSIFLATMSHEIRTPMNGVLGSLELLALTALSDSQRATVAMAEQSGRELLRLLDDILDFSKIEAGRLELQHERSALREQVIDKVIATYAPLAHRKGLALRSRIDPAVAPWFCTDPLRLRQILHNFVSNAVKFTLAGSIDVVLDVIDTQPGAQLLRFSVRDTGIGISAANQARLFQPFVQADGDTTRRFGGTGLGLAICRGLAAGMDGIISMHSAPGIGTTMSLELSLPVPSGAAEATRAAPSTSAAPSVPATGAAPQHGLLLVVDDHATNRNVLVRQLAALGYAADSAVDGVDALAQLAAGRHALVISDCEMPEMDGYTLARAIRADEARRGLARLPIIACTANAYASDAARATAAGMDDYLAKPTTIAELRAVLRRHLPPPPAPLPPGAAVLDETHMAAMVGNDAAARALLLAEFDRCCDSDAIALDAAWQAGDLDGLMRLAHRVCGASKMVGATALIAACTGIEHQGRERLAMTNAEAIDLSADPFGAPLRQDYQRLRLALADFKAWLAHDARQFIQPTI